MVMGFRFQTLIGTVKGVEAGRRYPQDPGVSNPHRYGQREKCRRARRAWVSSFKPS